MSFTRLAGLTHETGWNEQTVPEEECHEALRKQAARSDVRSPGLDFRGVSNGMMSLHPTAVYT